MREAPQGPFQNEMAGSGCNRRLTRKQRLDPARDAVDRAVRMPSTRRCLEACRTMSSKFLNIEKTRYSAYAGV
jgi:hypothetical protein